MQHLTVLHHLQVTAEVLTDLLQFADSCNCADCQSFADEPSSRHILFRQKGEDMVPKFWLQYGDTAKACTRTQLINYTFSAVCL